MECGGAIHMGKFYFYFQKLILRADMKRLVLFMIDYTHNWRNINFELKTIEKDKKKNN